MTTPVSTVLDYVSKALKDEVNWIFDLETELLPLLNLSVPQIVINDPLANPMDIQMLCTAGVTQTIPDDNLALIKVIANCGVAAADYGDAIDEISLDSMNSSRRGWRRDVMGSGLPGVPLFPYHWIALAKDPKRFDLWPAVKGTWYVDIKSSVVPDDVGISDNFPLPDIYIAASQHWIIANALAGRRPQLDDKGKFLVTYHTAEFDKSTMSSDTAKKQTVPKNEVQGP